jgi:hypothetical protein
MPLQAWQRIGRCSFFRHHAAGAGPAAVGRRCCRSRRLFLRKSDTGPGATSHPLVARFVCCWGDRLTGEDGPLPRKSLLGCGAAREPLTFGG